MYQRYKSTRGGTEQDYSFEEALFSGYAPDGGLFVPVSLPSVVGDKDQYLSWSKMSFPELAFDVLRKFISPTEIDNENLQSIYNKSYQTDAFDDECYIPIKEVGPSLHIAELFHGPTFCFKDFGMRPVINFLSYFAGLRNRPTTLLVSTTGDTGPAAVQAVNDVSNPLLTILVHYPQGQISDFQRKQLTTLQSDFVKVASFEGGGDDMDWPIKEMLLSSKNGSKQSCQDGGGRQFCGINSYNIGRPLVQMIHFIWIYLRMAEKLGLPPGDENFLLDMVLPTGAMGNLTGAYMAKQMGIPIGKLYCGVNINDITHRVIARGEFHQQKIEKTLSEALNVEVPYNFERILFYLTSGNELLVKEWMEDMDNTKRLTLEEPWLKRLQEDFNSASVTDDEMCNAIRETYESCDNYICDPHTAVAVAAANKLGCLCSEESSSSSTQQPVGELTVQPQRKVVIIATASPCKFEEAVTIALGQESWNKWKTEFFPSRAQRTMERQEVEPFHYEWGNRSSTLEEVQSVWKDKMMDIVSSHFGE